MLVVHFKTEDPFAVVTPGIGWTQDEAALNRHIDGLKIVRGHTVFFEAVQSMAEELDAKPNSNNSIERIMILITDGDEIIRRHKGMMTGTVQEDDERKRVRNQLIKNLKGSGIRVYAVGLTRELDSSSVIQFSRRDKVETHLRKITKETGGRAVFPQSKRIDIDSLLDELLAQ